MQKMPLNLLKLCNELKICKQIMQNLHTILRKLTKC